MIYNFLLFWVLLLQGAICFFLLKKKRAPIFQRFSFPKEIFSLPPKKRIWIHAVSYGEVKAFIPLLQKLKAFYPEAIYLFSTITPTGYEEAKRAAPYAKVFYLPFDFSWIMKRILHISPTYVFLVEGDYWYHFLKYAKQSKAQIQVVSAKISETSLRRLLYFPKFSRKLYSYIDRFCVQDETYYHHFIKLGIAAQKLSITGNLKWQPALSIYSEKELQKRRKEWGIHPSSWILTIGCSHDPEEKLLIFQLFSFLKEKKIHLFLAPRHPERAPFLVKWLESQTIKAALLSDPKASFMHFSVVVIDQMGVLSLCYQLSKLAILAGSFCPSFTGHNLLEPLFFHVPVLFGPYTSSQTTFKNQILSQGCGKEIPWENLGKTLEEIQKYPSRLEAMKQGIFPVIDSQQKPLENTWNVLFQKACCKELASTDKI